MELQSCSEYQVFRNWKQITTLVASKEQIIPLFRISGIQKLKANHNYAFFLWGVFCVVPNIRYSEIESKSQLASQTYQPTNGCSEYQVFRNWKQITTHYLSWAEWNELFRISGIQKLKANHNLKPLNGKSLSVVPNIRYSEIESKSQPILLTSLLVKCCSEYQVFRNWKQITTVKV